MLLGTVSGIKLQERGHHQTGDKSINIYRRHVETCRKDRKNEI